MILKPQEVHLWQAYVPDWLSQVETVSQLLNAAELQRAKRFVFKEHQDRNIIARALLRRIISRYVAVSAEELIFIQGKRGKPYLQTPSTTLQFNVSHSHDWVVYALAWNIELGVDIEKMKPSPDLDIAKRFFSPAEYVQLVARPPEDQSRAFYHLWAGKEAVIKALGEGLYAPLDDFSIDAVQTRQLIELKHPTYPQHYLQYFTVDLNYQSAVAATQVISQLRHFTESPPKNIA